MVRDGGSGPAGGRPAGDGGGPEPLARLGGLLAGSPHRITAVYLAFGLAALLVSDVLLVRFLSDPLLSRVQALKAGAEVFVTAGLIFVLTAASRATHRETTAELERHREELRVLHRLLRHNLRNDLNVVQGEVERLREVVGEDHQPGCERVIETAEEIVEYVERARTIRKLTELESQTIDLAALVPSIVDDVCDDVAVSVDVPESAPVQVNELFETALAELVTNAVVHGEERPHVEITVAPDAGRGERTLVEIRDDGPGLPEHTAEVLRGEKHDQLVHLDGLGLWLVYLTVVESGGEFELPDDGTGEGTTVRLHLLTPEAADGRLLPAVA